MGGISFLVKARCSSQEWETLVLQLLAAVRRPQLMHKKMVKMWSLPISALPQLVCSASDFT